ncbi:hypothetical protein CDAR_480321 [Caerostris darwini]|uniref:Uncharacterized protein n=1 Tax=Caerostris darwini TaxID=1538125 RepID=A0AAV4V1U3_9ARAC|nr:hypothetical protein CDAR_480321 [Caerostris darwini]
MSRERMEQKCLFDATISVSDALLDGPGLLFVSFWAVMRVRVGSAPQGVVFVVFGKAITPNVPCPLLPPEGLHNVNSGLTEMPMYGFSLG